MDASVEREVDLKVLIVSDVSSRDGIGVEIYSGGEIVMEIFRDDTKKVREVSLFGKPLSLELIEWGIRTFKEEIPWEFQVEEDQHNER